MFSFFKRPASKPAKVNAKASAKPAPRHDSSQRDSVPELAEEPLLPEVVEGNEHSDWALWEDSVMALDSQMQSLTPTANIYEKDSQAPSEFQDIDPFSRVSKNSG